MPRQFFGNFLNPWRACQTLLQKAYSRHSWELLILLWLNGSPLAIAFSILEVIKIFPIHLGNPNPFFVSHHPFLCILVAVCEVGQETNSRH